MILLEVEEQEEELDHDQKLQKKPENSCKPQNRTRTLFTNSQQSFEHGFDHPLRKMLKKTATLVGDGFPNIALITVMTHLLWNSAVIDQVYTKFLF